ncbi:MAG: hypothetical protein ACXABY_23990, partial [Candidatus Thorarchaeota archaeon]
MKMKMTKLLSSLVAVFVGIVLFLPSSALAAAFGVSPPWIENENLKAGSNFIYVINLSANDFSDDMIVKSELEGDPEVMQWLTIQNKDNLVMTKGQSIVPMSVNVNIPEDAKVGSYQGSLRLSVIPKNDNTNNVAVLLGGNVAIKLNVIDYDVTDYWIQSINIDPISEGQAIKLKMGVKNIGNTEVTSVMTNFSITDTVTGEEVLSSSVDKLNMPIYPHTLSNAELSVSVPDLTAGDYWLNVESFEEGESLYKDRLHLTVNPSITSNTATTSVDVPGEGWIKPAASNRDGSSATVQTSVKVRAPL